MSIPERDWKIFRKFQDELISKACESVFVKVDKLSAARSNDEHQAYLRLYDLIQVENKLIAEMFDNPTRNNVFFKIIALKRSGIISDEQFKQFSEETQKSVTELL